MSYASLGALKFPITKPPKKIRGKVTVYSKTGWSSGKPNQGIQITDYFVKNDKVYQAFLEEIRTYMGVSRMCPVVYVAGQESKSGKVAPFDFLRSGLLGPPSGSSYAASGDPRAVNVRDLLVDMDWLDFKGTSAFTPNGYDISGFVQKNLPIPTSNRYLKTWGTCDFPLTKDAKKILADKAAVAAKLAQAEVDEKKRREAAALAKEPEIRSAVDKLATELLQEQKAAFDKYRLITISGIVAGFATIWLMRRK